MNKLPITLALLAGATLTGSAMSQSLRPKEPIPMERSRGALSEVSASGSASAQVTGESVSLARAAHGLVVEDGVLIGGGGDYKVVFNRGGVQFTPALGDAVEVNQNLRLTLESVRRGNTTVLATRESARPDLSRIEESIAQYVHGDIVERYEVRADALKQSFVFDSQPEGDGDLIVRLRIETNMTADPGERIATLNFRAGKVDAAHIGAVVGIDAAGMEIVGHMNYSGPHLELVLPSDFVSAASYPLVLDPPVCCGQILASDTKPFRHPDVAYGPNHDHYLVVWEHVNSAADHDIRGHLVSGTGTPIGKLLFIDDRTGRAESPSVCYVNHSYKFVVAYEYTAMAAQGQFITSDIVGRTVDSLSSATGAYTTLAASLTNDLNPSLGGDLGYWGQYCVLVYETEGSNVIRSARFKVDHRGLIVESVSLRRNIGIGAIGGGTVSAMPEISKDAGVDSTYVIAWVANEQESAIGIRLMSLFGGFRSAAGQLSGARMRNPEVAGDGRNFVVAWEQAAVSGPKQDIWSMRLEQPSPYTNPPVGYAKVPIMADSNLDFTDPAIGMDGDRCLVGISRERNAPRGPYTLMAVFSTPSMTLRDNWYGTGSVASYSYNLESTIALRVPRVGGVFDGLSVFRQEKVTFSDIRVWRLTDTKNSNDECAGATPLALGLSPIFDTNFASDSVPAWTCGYKPGNDLWLKYTPTTQIGKLTLSVSTPSSSTIQCVMEVFEGSCGSLSLLACDESSWISPPQPEVTINCASAGKTYYLRIGGFDGQRGRFQVRVRQTSHASVTFNQSCPAAPHSFGGPVLSFGGQPKIGANLSITGALLSGSPLCTLLLGAKTAPIPLSTIGSLVSGSALCIKPVFHSLPSTTSSPFGSTQVQLPIPNTPHLCGIELEVQWIDYQGTGMDFGTSRSATLKIGN